MANQQFRCQYCKNLIQINTNSNKLDRIDPTRSMFIFKFEENNIIEMQPINNCLNCLELKYKELNQYLYDAYHVNYLTYKNYKPTVQKINNTLTTNTITINYYSNDNINDEINKLEEEYWKEYNDIHNQIINENKSDTKFIKEWETCINNWSLFYELKNWNPKIIDWNEINWILSQMILYINTKHKININIKWKLKYKDCESSIINTITEYEYPLYYNNNNQNTLMNLLINNQEYNLFNRGLTNLLDYVWVQSLNKTKNYKRFDSNGIINTKTKKIYKLEYVNDYDFLNTNNFLESLVLLKNLLIM